MPDARYRLEDVLADIKRLHQELQSQELQSQELQSQELQSQELQSQELQSQELQSQEMRPAWQPFALGFAIGSVFFAAAIAFVKFHG
jgi:uncharacterized protein (DUF2062 family)